MKQEDNKKELELPIEHLAVYKAISNSKEKYVTKNMILTQIGKGISYRRQVERIISDLVKKYKMPVGASSARETKGYFIITTKHDLYIAKRDIKSRAFNLTERANALDELDI